MKAGRRVWSEFKKPRLFSHRRYHEGNIAAYSPLQNPEHLMLFLLIFFRADVVAATVLLVLRACATTRSPDHGCSRIFNKDKRRIHSSCDVYE